MRIEFEGLSELTKELERKFDKSQNEDVLKKGAEYFKERLEESVYDYGLKKRSGKSEKSMAIEMKKGSDEIYVGLSNQKNDAFYLYFHEFGTSKFRARPWLRPTFEREQQAIIKKMADEMRVKLGL